MGSHSLRACSVGVGSHSLRNSLADELPRDCVVVGRPRVPTVCVDFGTARDPTVRVFVGTEWL